MNSDHFDGVYGKVNVLQNANTTLKRKVAAQAQEIDVLKRENLNLCKLLAERNRAESDATPNPLFGQMLALKEELDKTRHRLLQYEIFDEHSEVDINGLLEAPLLNNHHPTTTATSMCAVRSDSVATVETLKRKRFDTETMPLIGSVEHSEHESEWLRIEKHIQLGNVQSIEELMESNAISMNVGDAVNLHSMLEAAVSYNQREIVQKLICCRSGMKMGTKLLCHRYYGGETILVIAVTNGALEIASDLLEYYAVNTIHFGKEEDHVFPFLNMRDDGGRTLLMKVCSMDRADLVHWVLARYLKHKIELKTLIEARDDSGKDIFGGYVRSKTIESVIHEYAPLIASL